MEIILSLAILGRLVFGRGRHGGSLPIFEVGLLGFHPGSNPPFLPTTSLGWLGFSQSLPDWLGFELTTLVPGIG